MHYKFRVYFAESFVYFAEASVASSVQAVSYLAASEVALGTSQSL